jgi:hypothetical protein
MFIAPIFTIAKPWNQSRCPSTNEWIKKMWYVYTMEYYLVIKNEIMRNKEGPRATSRMHPDGLGRRGQGELSGTATDNLGQSSIAPWTDQPPPGEKRETE